MAATKKRKLPDGWMGKTSRTWLAEEAVHRDRIVEVGVWKGRTTTILARHCPGTLWAVDHWRGTPGDPKQHALYRDDVAADEGESVYQEFRSALATPIRSGKVIPLRMSSTEAAQLLDLTIGSTLDMVFIDADHSYEGASKDIRVWLPLLRTGGMLCGHDYHWPGVKQAVDESFGDRVTLGPRSLWSLTV